MIPIPVDIKIMFPGYRKKWKQRYQAMIDHVNEVEKDLICGFESETPWIKSNINNVQLYGFLTEPENIEVIKILKPYLSEELSIKHFRLIKDYINRYLYPHMRPDLKPTGYDVNQLFGFHGQHKDAIYDIDKKYQIALIDAFKPKKDDVIINCGAFLGFGDISLSPELAEGHIFAIEANKICFDLLKKNINTNNINNVTPLHNAIWNESKEIELECGFAQSNSLIEEVCKGKQTNLVEAVSIDELVDLHNLNKVDMISLTLNGAEVEALQGASNTLDKFRPRIRLAGWYSRDGIKICELTKTILEKHNYNVYIGPRGNLMALYNELES
jgi:FkbM family methyltransferase